MDKLPPLSSEKNKPLTKNNFLGALTKFTTVYQNVCKRVSSGQDNQDGRDYIKSKYTIDPDALNTYFDNLVNADVEILNPEEAAMVKVLEAASKYMDVDSRPDYEFMDAEIQIACLNQLEEEAAEEKTKAREENNFKKVRYWSDVANRVDLMKRLYQGDEVSYDDENKIHPNLGNVDYLLAMLDPDGRVRSIEEVVTAGSLHELAHDFDIQAGIETMILQLATEKR